VKKWQVAAIAIAAVVVIAGKQYYRSASAGDLAWILAPTAHAVTWLGCGHFVFDAQQGWVDSSLGFAIAPACAGLHFALAAFLALVIGGLSRITDWKSLARTLGAAAVIAYVATLVVNTIRIALAIEMRRPDLHQMEGTLVYLGGLVLLYALARRHHELART
jgi:exosortase K